MYCDKKFLHTYFVCVEYVCLIIHSDDKMETDMPIHQKDATTDNMITSTEGRLLMHLSRTYVYTCKVSGISLIKYYQWS